MRKKKIAWISLTFIETDIYVVRELRKTFDIEWHVLTKKNEKNEFERDLQQMRGLAGLTIIRDAVHRNRDIRSFFDFRKILKSIKRSNADYVYAGVCGYPHALPQIKAILGLKHVVVPVHNVSTPKGASRQKFQRWNTARILDTYENFQTFSVSQYNYLRNLKPEKNVFYTPFLLKDYGRPTSKPDSKITFLNFGIIREYKRVDVLIEAAQRAFEQTGKDFLVEIAGKCDNWEWYQKKIRYPQLFRLTIRRIQNEEIPDLFGRCHYFVVPYQDIAQSGSVVVGINYDKPIIASDLEAFREHVVDGVDGYLMKPASVDSLTDIMVHILNNHESIYPTLVEGLKKMKEEKFSTTAIIKKYVEMFENLK